jgi:periplasmic protein TonB
VFENLLPSDIASSPWVRPAASAILLHLGVILGAVAGTVTSPGSAPAARDTIRLELSRPAPEAAGPLPRAAPPNPHSIPEAPRPPDIRLATPRLDPTPLDWNTPMDPVALSGAALLRDSSEVSSARDGSSSVSSLTEVDQLPELTDELHPRYPEALRQWGLSGEVRLEYVISTEGRVDPRTIRVLQSTHPAFATAATAAVGGARFRPARHGGRAVAVLVQQTIRFLSR